MVQGECFSNVFVTESKARAANFVGTAHTASKAAHECSLTATQVTNKLYSLAAPKLSPELLAELLGLLCAGRSNF